MTLSWGIFSLSCFFQPIFWKQNWKIIYLWNWFQISKKTHFGFGFTLPENNKCNTPEFSPFLLFRNEYPVTPNPIMCMMNEISYVRRLKISSSCPSSRDKHTCGNSECKTSYWSWWTSAWAYRKDQEVSEFDWRSSSDISWHQAVCGHLL